VFEIDPLMTFDVDKQILVLKIAVSAVLDHVKSGNTVILGPINIEMHHYVLVSARICCFRGSNRSCPPPLVECLVSMGCNFLGITHGIDDTRIASDLVDCSVEVGDLAIGGEDIGPEKISHATLGNVRRRFHTISMRQCLQ
jgi:hypothetical protein